MTQTLNDINHIVAQNTKLKYDLLLRVLNNFLEGMKLPNITDPQEFKDIPHNKLLLDNMSYRKGTGDDIDDTNINIYNQLIKDVYAFFPYFSKQHKRVTEKHILQMISHMCDVLYMQFVSYYKKVNNVNTKLYKIKFNHTNI
jgi:hypothetical protein